MGQSGRLAHPLDLIRHILELAADQDFIRRPQVGPPVNVGLPIRYLMIGILGIEHHHQAVGIAHLTGGEAPAGGDFNRAANLIERHLVLRGQRLNAGDARDHLEFEGTGA